MYHPIVEKLPCAARKQGGSSADLVPFRCKLVYDENLEATDKTDKSLDEIIKAISEYAPINTSPPYYINFPLGALQLITGRNDIRKQWHRPGNPAFEAVIIRIQRQININLQQQIP
jgi:hypothetical protein